METETPEFAQTPYSEKPRGLFLTQEGQYYLAEAGKWANFLAIVGFIVCGLFLIMALFIGTLFSALSSFSTTASPMPSGFAPVLTVVFILFDVLYFFFPYYLYQFAGRLKRGLAIMDSDQLAESFGKLKSFFKLCGIVTIVMLCIYALEIVVVFFAAVARH